MSRIIVKGLPPRCNEHQLKEVFKHYGTITDCALKFTKEGKFRRFAFVGFEDGDSGKEAIGKTNDTFIGSYKLQVEECKGFGDNAKPRAWSKYAKDSSAYKRKHGDETPAAPVKKQKNDEKDEDEEESESAKRQKAKREEDFKNFLEAKGVARNEAAQEAPAAPIEEEERDEGLLKQLLEDIKGDTHLSVVVSGLPSSIKQKHVKDWFAPIRVKALKVVRDDKAGASFVSFEKTGDVKRALLKNNLFLGGYKVSVKPIPGSDRPQPEQAEGGGGGKEKRVLANPGMSREEEEAKMRDAILETGRLFLRNLPFSTTEGDLRAAMKQYGELADVQVIIAKSTGACKGFAIVEFMFPEAAVAAYAALDGSIFKGRMLHILPGEEKREEEKEEEGGEEGEDGKKKKKPDEKSSFKREQAEKRKKAAGKQAHSWNALFLGANAVADSLAEKLGVGKADILSSEGGESAAVRLALAETRIVRETRDFLMKNGVRLDAFSRPATKRSDTVILVKNLPAGVEQEELQRMFEKFGDLNSVLIPPEGGVSALIVFGNSVDAKAAFSKLAYARFRTQPLYLEWAPGDVFEQEEKKEEEAGEGESSSHPEKTSKSEKKRKGEEMTAEEKREERKSKKHRKKEVEEEEMKEEVKEEVKEEEEEEVKMEVKEEVKEEEEEEVKMEVEEMEEKGGEEEEEGEKAEDRGDPEENAVVFVKNLSWETDDAQLEGLFKQRFEIVHAKVSRKFNPADPSGPQLSMGFGFVQFWTREEAMEAIKTMQGALLAGHSIELKHSNREMTDEGKKKQRKTVDKLEQGESLKLIVRNVPFQASPAEVESLFSAFGGLKSVRFPKKVGAGAGHRGFGFVDFSTKGDAKRAFDALVHSTHLYGRRLVLEWARGEEESVEQLREKTASRFAGGAKEHRKLKKRMEAIEKDLKVIDDD